MRQFATPHNPFLGANEVFYPEKELGVGRQGLYPRERVASACRAFVWSMKPPASRQRWRGTSGRERSTNGSVIPAARSSELGSAS
jgi:hypothetical protein